MPGQPGDGGPSGRPPDGRLSRRALLAGAAAAAGSVVAGAVVLPRLRPGTSSAPRVQPGHVTAATDLTVRWRRLIPRVRTYDVWSDLVAAWSFDEAAGYRFTDLTGAGHDLLVTGSEWNTTESGLLGAVHRPGLRGGAVWLNGTRWLAARPDLDLAPDDRGLSVTAWLRLGSEPARSATVLSVGPSAALSVEADGHAVWTLTTAAGRQVAVRADSALPIGAWTHLAATVDPTAGAAWLYLNGRPAGSVATDAFSFPPPSPTEVVAGANLVGLLDEATLHRGALEQGPTERIRLLGLPRTYTQSRESIDPDRGLLTRYKGSDPVPHPVEATTAMTLRFAASLLSDQGVGPVDTPPADYVPAWFGCGWRSTGEAATYPSPLAGSAGTFEAWYRVVPRDGDPQRQGVYVVFTARSSSTRATLVLSTQQGAWRVDLTSSSGRRTSVAAPAQPFPASALAHVAVSWGAVLARGRTGVLVLVDGRPVAALTASAASTTYDGTLSLGGTARAPAYCVFEDARVSDVALGWADVCPRGQAATEASGLDLRDFFRRATGLAPLWWRTGAEGGTAWTVGRRSWQDTAAVGDDPDANLAVRQAEPSGWRTLYHPDAFGTASSIEAGVSVDTAVDGWAGVFVQSASYERVFSGVTFMVDVERSQLRLALHRAGRIVAQKTLPSEFPLRSKKIYELTLTSAGDGVVRGFVDGTNVISMRADQSWPTQGFAGLVADGTAADFSPVHFTALTPAVPASRVVSVRKITTSDAALSTVTLEPFQWRKRHGLLPWRYDTQDPEPPGNIAGADTAVPRRPIPAARWRSEDSANSDLIVVDGTVWYLMRGNPRVGSTWSQARIGMLHKAVPDFDGVHFDDPNEHTDRLRGGGRLLTASPYPPAGPSGSKQPNLNAPSSAYAGGRQLLFLGRESGPLPEQTVGETVFARFDLQRGKWVTDDAPPVSWNTGPVEQRIRATPELVSLRDPDDDELRGVVFGQIGPTGDLAMATALVDNLAVGVPTLVDGSVRRSLQRPSKGAIYGFRVMFDNGIYYLHYNDGPVVPDWPDRFVLAAALDPHEGPWVRNESTNSESSPYFRRGTALQPDNGAVWQGTMFKHGGHYYLYYENYHSIGDVDQPYGDYGAPQAGSRVGFATA